MHGKELVSSLAQSCCISVVLILRETNWVSFTRHTPEITLVSDVSNKPRSDLGSRSLIWSTFLTFDLIFCPLLSNLGWRPRNKAPSSYSWSRRDACFSGYHLVYTQSWSFFCCFEREALQVCPQRVVHENLRQRVGAPYQTLTTSLPIALSILVAIPTNCPCFSSFQIGSPFASSSTR